MTGYSANCSNGSYTRSNAAAEAVPAAAGCNADSCRCPNADCPFGDFGRAASRAVGSVADGFANYDLAAGGFGLRVAAGRYHDAVGHAAAPLVDVDFATSAVVLVGSAGFVGAVPIDAGVPVAVAELAVAAAKHAAVPAGVAGPVAAAVPNVGAGRPGAAAPVAVVAVEKRGAVLFAADAVGPVAGAIDPVAPCGLVAAVDCLPGVAVVASGCPGSSIRPGRDYSGRWPSHSPRQTVPHRRTTTN